MDYQHRNSIGGGDLWRLAFIETLEKPRGHGEGSESDVPLSALTAGGGGWAGGGGHDSKDVRRPSLLKAGSIRHPKGSLSLSGKQISGKFLQGIGGLIGSIRHVHQSGVGIVYSSTHEEEEEHDSQSPPVHQGEEMEHASISLPHTNTSTTTSPSHPNATNINNITITNSGTIPDPSSTRPTKLTPLKEGIDETQPTNPLSKDSTSSTHNTGFPPPDTVLFKKNCPSRG